MRLPSLLASLALFTSAALALDVKITALQNGKVVDPSQIKLEEYAPSVHRLNRTTSGGISPPKLPTKFKGRDSKHERRQDISPNPDRRSIIYSADWCGAHSATTTSNKITNVQGYFQVPSPTLRPNTAQPQYVGAWIGLDGYTWSSALLQAGTASAVSLLILLS
jgi:hypothetical protein